MVVKFNGVSNLVEKSVAVESALSALMHEAETENTVSFIAYSDKKNSSTVNVTVERASSVGRFNDSRFYVQYIFISPYVGHVSAEQLADMLHDMVKSLTLPCFILNPRKFSLTPAPTSWASWDNSEE